MTSPETPWPPEVYGRAHRFMDAQAEVAAHLVWMTLFFGAATRRMTPEQFTALEQDVKQFEEAAAYLAATVRDLIGEMR